MFEQKNTRAYNFFEGEEKEIELCNEELKSLYREKSKDLKNYQYIVTTSQQSFNWFYLYAKELTLKDLKFTRVISETALLGEVKTIAQEFVENGSLPKILFVDVIGDEGVSLYRTINNFIQALSNKLIFGKGIYSLKELREKILENICIRVIVGKDDIPMMSDDMRWKVVVYRFLHTRDLHKRRENVSKYINKHDVAMTSYIISAFRNLLTPVSTKNKNWKQVQCEYQMENSGKRIVQTVFSFDKNADNIGAIPFVYHYEYEDKSYFTPFVFHENLKKQDLTLIFEKLRSLMKEKRLHFFEMHMENAIKEEDKCLILYYTQMAEMLINQIVLKCFLYEEFGENDTKFEFDWEKISLNFFAQGGTWLKELCNTQWSYQDMQEILAILPTVSGLPKSVDTECKNDEEIFEYVITQAYDDRIKYLCRTQEFKKNNKSTNLFEEKIKCMLPSVISFRKIIQYGIKHNMNWKKALCMVLYMRSIGTFEMRIEYEKDDEIEIKYYVTDMIAFGYSIFFEKEWKKIAKTAALCRWVGESYKDKLPEILCKTGDSKLKQERINLIGTTLSKYPELYVEILSW